MEYQSRKVKWYWMFAFVAFCAGVIYLLFTGNPYLYSQDNLRAVLTAGDSASRHPIPRHPEPPAKVGGPTGLARYNFQRTAVDPVGLVRSRAYVEAERHPVATPEKFDVQSVVADAAGFVLTGRSSVALAIDLEGQTRWAYEFLHDPGERGLYPAVLDESGAYLVHPNGEVVCVERKTGRLRWLLDTTHDLVAAPFAWGKDLVLPVKNGSGVQILQIHRADGSMEAAPVRLDLKPGFTLAQAPSLDALIATQDNKVVAIDPETWKVMWSQTLTEPARGPAVIVETQIFLSTPGGKLVRLDGAKRGKLDWDLDLPRPAATPPAYLPIMHRLALLDTEGQLVVVDARLGKLLWRVPTANRNPLLETWTARLKGHNIEEFKMDWLHKGWTVWSPCAEKKFCIYTPNKGQLIERVALSGSPVALPVALDKRWIFLTQTTPGHWSVSKLVEESEFKKTKAAAESTNQKTQ